MNDLAPELSLRNERTVARKFIGRVQWEMIVVGLGQFTIWLTTFALVIVGALPLWLGFVIATVCACLAYLPSHEGQHGNISGMRENLFWLDSLVGHLSVVPLSLPFRFLRCTHMKHHAYTNDPLKDPDHHYVADHWWQAVLSAHREPPRDMIEYHMANDQVFRKDLAIGLAQRKAYSVVMVVCALIWPLPTLLVWWLPQKIGLSYLIVFFAHNPHKVGPQLERYRLARFWSTYVVPRFAVQSMTHHAVHHLYPRIPHWSQPAALAELRPFVEAHDMEGAELLAEL